MTGIKLFPLSNDDDQMMTVKGSFLIRKSALLFNSLKVGPCYYVTFFCKKCYKGT